MISRKSKNKTISDGWALTNWRSGLLATSIMIIVIMKKSLRHHNYFLFNDAEWP